MTNSLNKFFCNIPKQNENVIPKTTQKFTDYLPEQVGDLLFLARTSEGNVSNYLRPIKNNKVIGPSNIPNQILKQFGIH